MELDFQKYYKVESWPGVAVYLVEHPSEYREDWVFVGEPEDDRSDEDNYVLESWLEIDDTMVYVTMVGDDARHLVDVDSLISIDDEDFCRECGQIGCGHNVYS